MRHQVASLLAQLALLRHRSSGVEGFTATSTSTGSFVGHNLNPSRSFLRQRLAHISPKSSQSSSARDLSRGREGVLHLPAAARDSEDTTPDNNMAATSSADIELKSETACFGGRLLRYVHQSKSTKTPMTFSVFLPPNAAKIAPVPVLYYLSGLTCTDENFIQKAGAQRTAALRGVALVVPDTSPRGAGVEGEDEGWDFGTGAGFYVDATEPKWKEHYRMYEYVTQELPAIVAENFPIDTSKASIFGHSMGGHGALVIAFRNPEKYRSVSTFSAICHPVECAWGKKAFGGYLGGDKAAWKEYDATELMLRDGPFPSLGKIVLDQGSADNFFKDGQLTPEVLKRACDEKGQPSELRFHDGYDHSYFFISSFVEDHINMHADRLFAP